jgi:hypothetical protein
MPVPQAITQMGASAHLCGTFPLPFNNPKATAANRTQLTRNFLVYLEVAMQSKHDANMRAYCNTVNVAPRRADGTQVKSGADGPQALAVFYVIKSRTAAEVTRDQMVQKWQSQGNTETDVFTPGVRVDASIQKKVQTDNFQYEISYWYDNQDIYVLHHCYPSK